MCGGGSVGSAIRNVVKPVTTIAAAIPGPHQVVAIPAAMALNAGGAVEGFSQGDILGGALNTVGAIAPMLPGGALSKAVISPTGATTGYTSALGNFGTSGLANAIGQNQGLVAALGAANSLGGGLMGGSTQDLPGAPSTNINDYLKDYTVVASDGITPGYTHPLDATRSPIFVAGGSSPNTGALPYSTGLTIGGQAPVKNWTAKRTSGQNGDGDTSAADIILFDPFQYYYT
jgi:hypothetical protein